MTKSILDRGRSPLIARVSDLAVGLAVAGLLGIGIAAPASAREAIDPNSLNPAPPASFNATCYRNGSHIACDLAFSDPPVVDDDSGIVCDGTAIHISQFRSVVGKRLYDAGGNLLQRHFRETLDGTFTNPRTGQVVLWTQHDTVIHDLAVPGDTSTGAEKVSGLETRAWLPGGGTVLTDAGRFVTDVSTDEVVSISAHHPFDDYFRLGDASAVAPLCAALT
ncbi:hypothetical protein FHX52_0921 [Humibacillus xanthopallidus]|uniref:Uncharacterized protein n=1 Tax=Humibacillus xanthopallidus TaxID=412689 RepID=A0A543PUQ6_9MICO|nr:hypothetical protein [Humibacillus xanthopallidus]TQN47803.1 hypothetical protein FHX52_0921 [Humibacillus xanthopallidus]